MSAHMVWITVFIISLAVLIKSSDFFAAASKVIGIELGMPPFIVGVTIVALGTSLPELISSILAVHMGSSEIVIGNVLGSNITNIFLILGCTAIIGKNIQLQFEIAFVDLSLLMGSTLLLSMMIWDALFSVFEAVLCLSGLAVYMIYASGSRYGAVVSDSRTLIRPRSAGKHHVFLKQGIILVMSGVFIYIGSRFTVISIVRLSSILNVGKEIIAASAVALGTSLPELMVSISAARHGDAEMAIGNILGSNIFNAFAVMGIPALLGPLAFPPGMIRDVLPIMIIATFLFFVITQAKRITQWEGWLLLIFYIYFLSSLISG